MKKWILILALSLFQGISLAQELQDVGISKYAVLEVLDDNTPLRISDDEDSQRLTHLFKNAVLFADKQNENYFRVELQEGNYAWINKKFVEVQAIIPEKRFDNISKIIFKNEKDRFQARIITPSQSAFTIKEEGNNLNFTLFDNRYDPIETKITNKNNRFLLDEEINNDLNLKFLNTKPLFGYDLEKTQDGYLLTIKKAPIICKNKPLKDIVITIDPGHGGCEKGACAFNLEEKIINLQISKALRKELRKKGAKVYLTRKNDKQISLNDRISFAKEKNSDILLSIHQNSLLNREEIYKKHGVGTYYYHPQAKSLAQNIQENLLMSTGFKDDGINYASFALTRPTSQISVLVECGYIIKKEEAEKLINKKFQKTIARAITRGCEQYLKENFY
ncbi:MAG: N-acetylmuramoyl-L-alanine amidase [Candidatus Gastranaerophilales bacterium]|nr:N-acetylmuramoyl-L-alanine amidase [Candidatus Gastranaerophilales bacterium]